MIVVCDTTPLRYLAEIGGLEWRPTMSDFLRRLANEFPAFLHDVRLQSANGTLHPSPGQRPGLSDRKKFGALKGRSISLGAAIGWGAPSGLDIALGGRPGALPRAGMERRVAAEGDGRCPLR